MNLMIFWCSSGDLCQWNFAIVVW